jgi:transposase
MGMTKRDARFLSPEAQAEIRLRVINAVQGGMTQAQAARTFGVSRWSVVQWVKAHRGNGVRALAPKRRGRRAGEAGKLSPKQCERMRGLIVGKMPEQLKLPFYLWTRAAVQLLIQREYAVRLSLTAVGGYLKRWGLSVQRPVKRAMSGRAGVRSCKVADERRRTRHGSSPTHRISRRFVPRHVAW